MSPSDLLATLGVGLLLIAFLMNLINKLDKNGPTYTSLNFIGASLCGIAALMISFYPFVVLESVWALVSLFALIKYVSRGTPKGLGDKN